MKTKILVLLMLSLALILGAQMTQSPSMLPISVSVTGFVPQPGVYQLTVFSRLSDALLLSRGAPIKIDNPLQISYMEQKELERDSLYTHHQGLRQIRLTRQGKSQVYDLQKFLRMGSEDQNPLLKDGDLIWVPPLTQSVSISGNVYLPGDYQFVTGDKLGDILELCQGATPDADLRHVLIYRYPPGKPDFEVISQDLSRLTKPADASFALQDKDRIIIGKDSQSRLGWKVSIEGSVMAPGEFLISEKTTLWEVLKLCGGPAPRADFANAVLISGQYSGKVFPDIERLKEFSMLQMTPLEYNYMRSSQRQIQGKYSINLLETWESEGAKSNPVLHDGDYVFVPEKLDMVAVSGQVRKPGLVPFVAGKNWRYYIDACGGYTNNRKLNGVRVIRENSGNWVKPSKSIELRPGDMIFVAEKTDRDFWTDIKDVALLTSQIVTIIMSVRLLINNK